MFDAERAARQMALYERPRIVGDFETRSEVDLRDIGAWKYAEHPSTRILCFSFKLVNPDGSVIHPTRIWWPFYNEAVPPQLIEWLEAGYVFEAHNAMFERAIFTHIMTKKHGVPMPKYWADTMAGCAYRSLPMDLEDVGSVLDLPTKKDKRGKELLRKLCGPQKLKKQDIKEGKVYPNYNNDPVLMEELGAYCMTDTDTENALGIAIHDLPPNEYEVWCLDQTINERGVFVDIEALHAAAKIRDAVFEKLLKQITEITGGAVHSADERDKIIAWAETKGVTLDNMTADYVEDKASRLERLLKVEEDPDTRAVYKVLRIRQTLGKSSTKKIDKFIDWICADDRLRGLLQYHGASTGRWAGRGVQPQNFPRPDELLMFDTKADGKNLHDGIDKLLEIIRTGDADLLELVYGDPMEAMASALRGFIIAEPGNELYVSDFSAIEARVLAWIAGEQWKVDAFAAIDRGEGYHGSQDIYLATASMVFGYPCFTKKSHGPERQVGKVCELAFGYQGGVGAWRKFDTSDKWTDAEIDEKKKGWRAAHPMVQRLWYGLEEAAVKAVMLKTTTHYRDITYAYVQSSVGPWLACKLPNGRCLWYYNPEAVEAGVDRRTGEMKYQVQYEGKDNKRGGLWGVVRTYGGMLTENVVSAISRDLMVDAMFRVERAGYPIILTVHDEIVCERKIGSGGSLKEFNALMAIKEAWVTKSPIILPMAVAGYRAIRYRKD